MYSMTSFMISILAHKHANLKSRSNRGKRIVNCLVGLMLFFVTGFAHALTVEAVDDGFGVPLDKPLIVEFPGVLVNDTIDGKVAEDGVLGAELVSPVSNGTMTCPDPDYTTLKLCPDGSFEYTPGPGFSGTDSFTYIAYDGTTVSTTATVTLTA